MANQKRVVVLSDLQIPYQNNTVVQATLDFIQYYKPDELWCVGDELDAPEPSRWNKGMAGEYADTLQDSIDLTHQIMRNYRAALGKNKPFYRQIIIVESVQKLVIMKMHLIYKI